MEELGPLTPLVLSSQLSEYNGYKRKGKLRTPKRHEMQRKQRQKIDQKFYSVLKYI